MKFLFTISIHCQETGDDDNKNYQLRVIALMYDQILRTNTKRNVWKSLRRIHIHILGVKG